MGWFSDFWDDVTGKSAAEDAAKAQKQAQVEADNQAAKARTFAETEGQGKGSIGAIQLGIDDEEAVDKKLKKQTQLTL